MEIKRIIRVILLLCFTLICLGEISFGEEREAWLGYQVIRLLPEKIVPQFITIKVGTVLIWVNEDSNPITIEFTNASDMVISCAGSKNFIKDPEKIVSQMIPCAGVESLCIVQKGEFNYIVKRGPWEFGGTIIVD